MKKVYWFIDTQLGLNPCRTYRALAAIPRFVNDLLSFLKNYKGRLALLPCLHDRLEESGFAKDEYFWQDLYVAQRIKEANPQRHVDIGSRIDGFVAHIASFRKIEVFDIRPLNITIQGIVFKQMDLMKPDWLISEYCDSLSCLHALEHFGLGRYGDKVDINGHESGLRNMARMLSNGGTFYLSVPIGVERVEFNGHRVFDPRTVVLLAAQNQLILKSFAWVGQEGVLIESLEPESSFRNLSEQPYALGIFTFHKALKIE